MRNDKQAKRLDASCYFIGKYLTFVSPGRSRGTLFPVWR